MGYKCKTCDKIIGYFDDYVNHRAETDTGEILARYHLDCYKAKQENI